jgi:hypothetical protein
MRFCLFTAILGVAGLVWTANPGRAQAGAVQVITGLTSPEAAYAGTGPVVLEVGGTLNLSYSFSLFGADPGTAQVRWVRDGVVVTTTTISSIRNSTTLRRDGVTVSDSGTYRAEAIIGTTVIQSPPFAVIVQAVPPPVIKTEPAFEPWSVLTTTDLTVGATGTGPLTYQWFRGGVAIPGATISAYSLARGANAGGTYRVDVTNAGGTTRSRDVAIPDSPPVPAPVIYTQPASADVYLGELVSITVSGSYTTFRWLKNDAPLTGPQPSVITASTALAGRYSAILETASGSVTTDTAVLTVSAPTGLPRITQHPREQVQGEVPNTLSVGVEEGTTVTGYQWRRGGQPIAGATSASFSVPATGAGSTGTFDVVVTNASGSVTSEPAAIRASSPDDIILTAPASSALRLGSTSILLLSVKFLPNARYEWRRNGVLVRSSTTPSYSIVQAKAEDFGTYSLTAVAGAVSQTVAFKIMDLDAGRAPRFIRYPTKVSPFVAPIEGEPLVLSCTTRGEAPITVQWYKDGVLLAGQTAEQLTVPAVGRADLGNYQVRATNASGTAESRAYTVTAVQPPPLPGFVRQPASQRVAAGDTVTLGVVLSTATTPETYQWYFNDAPVPGAAAATLTLTLFHPSQVGRYRLRVTNHGGEVWSEEVRLDLAPGGAAPVIVAGPAETSVSLGGYATLTVKAAASPIGLRYEWRQNGQVLPGATTATLQLVGLAAGQAGTFSATASNFFGSATASARVTVSSARTSFPTGPVLAAQSASQSVEMGGTVTLAAQPGGDPQPALQWYREGTAIPGATGSTLTLSNVSAAEAGSYWVVATNSSGTARTSLIRLTTRAAPGRLGNLSVLSKLAPGGNLLLGLAVAGEGERSLLVRAAGPALAGFGVADAAPDPVLRMRDARGEIVAQNDNWGGSAAIAAAATAAGAFPLGAEARDAALLRPFAGGANTAEITEAQGAGGTVLAEVYAGPAGAGPRLANLSCRVKAVPGAATVTVGFVVEERPLVVLIRGIGPTLRWFGVDGAMISPTMRLYRGQRIIANSDDWLGTSSLAVTAAQVGAFPLSSASRDAALVASLTPGPYTVQITGVQGSPFGEVLAEIYEVPFASATVTEGTP